MALTTRVFSAGKVLLLIVALAATYLVSAAIAMRVSLRVSEVRVPALAGQPLNAAGATLADLGLSLRVDEVRRVDRKVGAGRVSQQDPAPGTVARRGRTVKVWVSAGDQAPSVPALIGESERTAQLRLQQDGLALGGVSEIRSNDFPVDTVVAQDPPAQARATVVSLLVNRGHGAASYVMPDLIGVNGYRAAEVLRNEGACCMPAM
jgi:serine/threonine-protein kinase